MDCCWVSSQVVICLVAGLVMHNHNYNCPTRSTHTHILFARHLLYETVILLSPDTVPKFLRNL